MRGVILRLTDARLVDVAHDFPRQDVRAAAFWLDQILPSFPPAVHLAVVDPGVGTDRDALVARAGDHALVGPDNGLLRPVSRTLAGDGDVEWFRVAVADHEGTAGDVDSDPATTWPPDPASSTFHGRDVFAPAAARVHEQGVADLQDLDGLDPVAPDALVDLSFPDPTVTDETAIATALAVDGFGNVITNVPGDVLAPHFGDDVKANGVWAAARRTYAAVDPGHRVVTVGSHGNVELAVNQGRGDETFGVEAGGRVRLTW